MNLTNQKIRKAYSSTHRNRRKNYLFKLKLNMKNAFKYKKNRPTYNKRYKRRQKKKISQ